MAALLDCGWVVAFLGRRLLRVTLVIGALGNLELFSEDDGVQKFTMT